MNRNRAPETDSGVSGYTLHHPTCGWLAAGFAAVTEPGLCGGVVRPEVAKNLDSAVEESTDSRRCLASEGWPARPYTDIGACAHQCTDEAWLPDTPAAATVPRRTPLVSFLKGPGAARRGDWYGTNRYARGSGGRSGGDGCLFHYERSALAPGRVSLGKTPLGANTLQQAKISEA